MGNVPWSVETSATTGWVLLVGDPVKGVTAYAVESADDPDIEERFANETWWVVPVHRISDPDDTPGWHRRQALRAMQSHQDRA